MIPNNGGKQMRCSIYAVGLLLILTASPFTVMVAPPAPAPATSGISPWSMFRHDAGHTGLSTFTARPAPTRWQLSTGDWVSSSPAIGADGTLYAGSDDQSLYAVNPNGLIKWKFGTAGHVFSSPAIGADGTIYVGSLDHRLYAVNPNGLMKWEFTTGDMVLSSPAIGPDGTVYVGSVDHRLYAVNPNGSIKWSFGTGGSITLSSPAIGADGTVYVGSEDHKLYAISSDGAVKWSFATLGDIESSPSLGSDGTVYVGSLDHRLYAVNPNGLMKWEFSTGGAISSSPAVNSDGTVYVGSDDQNLYAVNPDGSMMWSFGTGGNVFSSPAIGADGTVYVGSFDNALYAVDSNGTMKWNIVTRGPVLSSPAIGSDGTVYFGGSDDNLYAVGPMTLSTSEIGAVTVKCTRSSLMVGSSIVCRATVSGASPTGTINWFSNRPGWFTKGSCRLHAGTCSATYTTTSASSPVTITAIYGGDGNNPPSSRAYKLTLTMKPSKTITSCRQTFLFNEPSTTCTATVMGYDPTGKVSWFQAGGTGSVTFYPTARLLAPNSFAPGSHISWTSSRCAVTVRALGGYVIIRAAYAGDTNNKGSAADLILAAK